MTAAAVDRGGAIAALREALGTLYRELREESQGGVVPEAVFQAKTSALGVSGDGQGRLRAELYRMGLRIEDFTRHAPEDTPPSQKVAQGSVANPERLDAARTLLHRYVDPSGYVGEQALSTVARLTGLDAHETVLLRESVKVRGLRAAKPAPGPRNDSPAPRTAPGPAPRKSPAGDPFGQAVAAARAVIDADRSRRRADRHLLTAEEEIGLAVLLRGGADKVSREPSDKELAELPADHIRRLARDCLVAHNQRLVHSIAQGYQEQGLEYEDLAQHGMLGVLRAARKFDARKGFKFSTYATWWIRQSITRAIADEGALIRVPVHMHEVMRKVAATERRLQSEGRPWSAVDVAVACDLRVAAVEEVRQLSRRTVSLERVVGDGTHLGDLVIAERPLPSPERDVVGAMHVEYLLSTLRRADPRYVRIVCRRTGIDGDRPATLDTLGLEFGVTRERIRQLEVKAFKLLREELSGATTTGDQERSARAPKRWGSRRRKGRAASRRGAAA